jgi:hypothetical protein
MKCGKFRPQIALAITCGTAVAIVGMIVGVRLEAIEVVTAVLGAIFGFLGGVSLKLMEAE